MELLYVWINRSEPECIIGQEFNFSPKYNFNVDDLKKPRNIFCEETKNINLFKINDDENKIDNITAVVGANGSGKTTLLSFIATNGCERKLQERENYTASDLAKYECRKSIYIFIENGDLIVYHNLEEEVKCDFKTSNIYWNEPKKDNNRSLQLCNIRKQLIIYLSNSSFVPEKIINYSQSDSTCNVNLHPRSMYIVADRFYKNLFGKRGFEDKIQENDKGFAWIIKQKRDDRTFQELLDVQYYWFLLNNSNKEFFGNFKSKISICFENVFNLINEKYNDDIEIIEATKDGYYECSKQKPDKEPSELSKKYFEKISLFQKKYNFKDIENARRKNPVIVLYFNLLFDVFFHEDIFVLPEVDINNSIYEQIKASFFTEEYKGYLDDIKKMDDVLAACDMTENLIQNPDDRACSYDKIINKENKAFYEFISDIFKERKSYALRFIRIKNLEMSSGERAMQNMFSWLVLIPQLDEIMGFNRAAGGSAYNSKLLLIDEIDLYSHPEWQRKTMNLLISTIKVIERDKPIQIIVTSHSPLILSDFHQENIIYMNKRGGKTIVDEKKDHKQSFGANIYTLLKDSFFLKNGAVGEFSKSIILKIHKDLTNNVFLDEIKRDEYFQIINMIGEDVVKKEMLHLFNLKYDNTFHPIIKEFPQNTAELELLKKQLEDSLSEVNKKLTGDRHD